MTDSSETENANSKKLAAVLIEWSSLRAQLKESRDTAQALDQIRCIQYRKMQQECRHLLHRRFTWWQIARSPWHVWRLRRERRQLDDGARAHLDRGDWIRLNRLVARIEFGLHLDSLTVAHMRQLVGVGLLTERDAWRLLHSLGCRLKHDGVEPAPLTRPIATLGLTVGVALCLVALFLASRALIGLLGDCEYKVCQILGNGLLSSWLLFIGPLVVCSTWGRRDAAKVLQALLSCDPVSPSISQTEFKRRLFARLAW